MMNELSCCWAFGCHITVSNMAPVFSVNVWNRGTEHGRLTWAGTCAWWQWCALTPSDNTASSLSQHMDLTGTCSLTDVASPCCPCCGGVVVTSGDDSYGQCWWCVLEDVVEGRGWVGALSVLGVPTWPHVQRSKTSWNQPLISPWLVTKYSQNQATSNCSYLKQATATRKTTGLQFGPVQSYVYFQSFQLDLEALLELA